MLPRFLFSLTWRLTFGFAMLNLLAQLLGGLQPANPALVGFVEGCEGKSQPCWYGIVPGVTMDEGAEHVLIQAGYKETTISDYLDIYYSDALVPNYIEVHYTLNGPVEYLVLRNDDGIRIGDIMAVLGQPETLLYYPSPVEMTEYISYGNRSWLTRVNMLLGSGWESPYSSVSSFYIFQDNRSNQLQLAQSSWRGFMPLWRYCQFEATYSGCM